MNASDFANPNGTFRKNRGGGLTFVPHNLPPVVKYDGLATPILDAGTQLQSLEAASSSFRSRSQGCLPCARQYAARS